MPFGIASASMTGYAAVCHLQYPVNVLQCSFQFWNIQLVWTCILLQLSGLSDSLSLKLFASLPLFFTLPTTNVELGRNTVCIHQDVADCRCSASQWPWQWRQEKHGKCKKRHEQIEKARKVTKTASHLRMSTSENGQLKNFGAVRQVCTPNLEYTRVHQTWSAWNLLCLEKMSTSKKVRVRGRVWNALRTVTEYRHGISKQSALNATRSMPQ